MANYVYNRVICTKDFFEKYFLDDNPFGESPDQKIAWPKDYITFNKLFQCHSIEEYRTLTNCTTIDYGSGTSFHEIGTGRYEVLFDTRWYYPIKAIVKACELARGNLVWYAIEENEIYFSKFFWQDNQVMEETIFIENDEDFEDFRDDLWDDLSELPEFVYPDFWIWGYQPETKTGWTIWPSDDLSKRYLNNYPADKYYQMIKNNHQVKNNRLENKCYLMLVRGEFLWENAFYREILKRGLLYYQSDKVKRVRLTPPGVRARVIGSDTYRVKFTVIDHQITDMKCTCPFSETGAHCKHMAAVLYYLESEVPELAKLTLMSAEEKNEIAIKQLYQLIKIDPNYLITEADIKLLKKQDNQLFRKFNSNQIIPQGAEQAFSAAFEQLLSDDVDYLIEHRQLSAALAVIHHLHQKLKRQGFTVNYDTRDQLIANLEPLVDEIITVADKQLKQKIFDWVGNQYFINNTQGYTDRFIEHLFFDEFIEENYLKQKVDLMDQLIAERLTNFRGSWRYYYEDTVQIILKQLTIKEKISVDRLALAQYCTSYLVFGKIQKYFIALINNDQELALIIEKFKHDINLNASNNLEALLNKLALKELYLLAGKRQLYLKTILDLLINYHERGHFLFEELKSLYPNKTWFIKRIKIFRAIGLNKRQGKKQVKKERIAWSMAFSSSDYNLYLYYQYLDYFKDVYPDDLLLNWEAKINYLQRSKIKQSSESLLPYFFARMYKIPGGKTKVAELKQKWQINL